MTNHSLDAVLFEADHGCWVGQYLQYDIGAKADSLEERAYRMQLAIVGHIAICMNAQAEPFADLDAAPPEYLAIWERAKLNVSDAQESPNFRLPKFFPIPSSRMRVSA